MKEIILITGAGGMVAQKLALLLQPEYDIRFLTRTPVRENEFKWNIAAGTIDENALSDVTHIIHLAGANISEGRWTEQRKQEIILSRTNSARLILETLTRKDLKIKSFISASAVGFYDQHLTSAAIETDTKGTDFLSDVVFQWESEADLFLTEGVAERVVKLRSGVVLGPKGGALNKMQFPVKLGIGSALGTGKQFIPWIHIDDLCAIYTEAITNPAIKGTYNAVAPEFCTNEQFIRTLAKTLQKPFFFPRIPAFLIRLLLGEAACIVLEGRKISADKIQREGFSFKYSNLSAAFDDLLKTKTVS